MKETINKNGISVCPEGEEKYVYFNLMPRRRAKSLYCQYDYRHTNHKLFSTVAPTLEICREKRNKWLSEKIEDNSLSQHQYTYYIPPNYAVCATCAIGGYCNQVCKKFQRK